MREKEKAKEEQDFKDQIAHNQTYSLMIREKLANEKRRNKELLLRHMHENKIKQLKEEIDKKKYK